ncbi:polysaccharide deacetylase family protein [Mycetohabitans rhizoxinica]|uniref:polysaccharide deacetylase family protein n=1 Tax=Mycetohabitans rhizoxinica TaxID=412963 RepID=UPI0030CFFBB1
MGTPAAEFESPGTKQIGIAVLERGYQGAELRQVLPVLTGVGQPEESMNAHEGRDGTAPTGLSVRQVKQMRARVDFQSHKRFHPILTRCDDVECEQEITGSRRDIERLPGRPCAHFAYPNGNYGEREIRLLRAAGCRTARTCDVGWSDDATDPFRLRAIDIHDDSSLAWFIAQLTGIPLLLRYAWHGGGWRGRKPQF